VCFAENIAEITVSKKAGLHFYAKPILFIVCCRQFYIKINTYTPAILAEMPVPIILSSVFTWQQIITLTFYGLHYYYYYYYYYYISAKDRLLMHAFVF